MLFSWALHEACAFLLLDGEQQKEITKYCTENSPCGCVLGAALGFLKQVFFTWHYTAFFKWSLFLVLSHPTVFYHFLLCPLMQSKNMFLAVQTHKTLIYVIALSLVNSRPEDGCSCQLEKQPLAFWKRGRWKLYRFCIQNGNQCLFPENLHFTWPGEAGENSLWGSRYTSRIARTRGSISSTTWRYLDKSERQAVKWALLRNLEEASLTNSWAGESEKIQESHFPWQYWRWCCSRGTQPHSSCKQQGIYVLLPYGLRCLSYSHWLSLDRVLQGRLSVGKVPAHCICSVPSAGARMSWRLALLVEWAGRGWRSP